MCLLVLLSMNPISPTALRKVLRAALDACSSTVSDSTIESIVLDCGGDIRHALLCLDVALRTGQPRPSVPVLKGKRKGAKKQKVEEIESADDSEDNTGRGRARVVARCDAFSLSL